MCLEKNTPSPEHELLNQIQDEQQRDRDRGDHHDQRGGDRDAQVSQRTRHQGRYRGILYVPEEVTLQKIFKIYLHHKMRFTPFFNYSDILG